MKRIIGLTMAVFILFFGSASQAAPDDGKSASPITVSKTVSAAVKHLVKSSPPPKTAKKDAIGAEIDIRYPEFVSSAGPNPAVEAINKAIQARLLTLLEEKTPGSLDQLMEMFFKEYEKTLKDEPEMSGGWALKFEGNIRHSDEELLCLEIFSSIFLGGAHPNSNISYLVFSLKTGEALDLKAFVPEEKMAELNKIAETHFRKVRDLKPGETFEQAGFTFEGEKFSINRNFLVSAAGLGFCFNAYEIAPYALGSTELVIPWSDLKTIVSSAGPAKDFLK